MKGTCKYCDKPTRSQNTSMCQACYKLDLAVRNNPRAAESILGEYKGITWKGLWDYESPRYNPYVGREYVSQGCIIDNAYKGTTPKEEQ